MKSLISMLNEKELSLIVSLPENNIELAKAAIKGGADALKVHINVDHLASGNKFGSVTENAIFFQELLNEFDGPIGIVPGGRINNIDKREVEKLESMGFSYFSVYMHECPVFLLKSNLEKTVAGNHLYELEQLKYLNNTPIEAFEASIVNGEEYGEKLSFHDLLKYKSIVETVNIPVIVPSQRKLVPSDVSSLADTGIKAIMIGAIVTGNTPSSVEKATKEFKEEIQKKNNKVV